MAPVFDALAAQHADVRFIKVDIDTEALGNTVTDARVSAVVRALPQRCAACREGSRRRHAADVHVHARRQAAVRDPRR